MMSRLLLIAVLFVAGCGADGEPEPPAKPGLTISGEVGVGVVVVK
jgi:hypothetical protein